MHQPTEQPLGLFQIMEHPDGEYEVRTNMTDDEIAELVSEFIRENSNAPQMEQ